MLFRAFFAAFLYQVYHLFHLYRDTVLSGLYRLVVKVLVICLLYHRTKKRVTCAVYLRSKKYFRYL